MSNFLKKNSCTVELVYECIIYMCRVHYSTAHTNLCLQVCVYVCACVCVCVGGVVTSSRWQLRDHVVSEGAHPSRHQHGSGTLFHCSTTFPTRTEPTVTMLRFLVSSEYHFRTTQTIEHLWGLHNRLLWAATPNIQPSSS